MIRKSSIHIEKANIGEFYHNSREKDTNNSIFSKDDNYCSLKANEAMELYFNELKKRTELYQRRTGKKLHKKTITLFSAVINLNEKHTKEDLEKIVRFIEKRYNTKVIQFAIHKDEGHIDENGNKIINYHAHILFIGIDNEGVSVRRKMDKKDLITLQDEVAKLLNMPRGVNYTQEKKKRPKRLDTYEYKRAMKIKNDEVLKLKKELEKEKNLRKQTEEKNRKLKKDLLLKDAEIRKLELTKKGLEKRIQKLRNQMKDYNKLQEANEQYKLFTKDDYQTLSQIKKLLKVSTLKDINHMLNEFENSIKERIRKRQLELIEKHSTETGLIKKEKVIKTDKAKKIIKSTTSTKKDYGKEFIEAVFRVKQLQKELKQEKEKNQILKTKIKDLENENVKLKIERDYTEMEYEFNKENKAEKNGKNEINKTLTHTSKKRIKSSKNIGD
ncbi:hypothetical protein C3L23_03340 [Nautilia sp. PV-1]|uniref:hypothetical protein n=1 Tax=Nautilia sp. PV-1 TaxID=2579250 RepID=UPI000FDC65A3|nr:hypothetical protein [Nautilia sp. PV-1]AZV46337.1 hypothetical protein C3L23_03340 [Nautilia sp. PV-1]